MRTVKIRCHGVIGYVEVVRKTDQQPPELLGVTLLMPKAPRRTVPRQTAFIRYRDGALKSKRQPAPRQKGAPCSERHIVLMQELLTISDKNVTNKKLILDKRDDRSDDTPTSYDNYSLNWVPDLPTLSPAHGELKPAYIETPYNTHPRLIARLDIKFGNLGTTGVDPVQIPFGTKHCLPDARKRRPVAREFLLQFEVSDNQVLIESASLDGTHNADDDMLFEVTPRGFELVLGNESEEDIYEANLPIQPVDTLAAVCMAEFQTYYSMTTGGDSAAVIVPFLSSRPGVETCCSGGKFEPHNGTQTIVRASSTQTVSTPNRWQFLAYLAADNNLSELVADHIDKLEQPDDGVDVVIQVDRLNVPTERMALRKRGFVPIAHDLRNLNSGDAKVLTTFIKEGLKDSKAEHRAVFLLSHGAGILDFAFEKYKKKKTCAIFKYLGRFFFAVGLVIKALFAKKLYLFDKIGIESMNPDHTSLDYLNNQELRDGLLNARPGGTPFPIVGFDACVMSLVELAYEIRECATYMIASQDDVRVVGFPYDKILKKVSNLKPDAAAREIVLQYGESTEKDVLATLSAIVLANVPDVITAMNVLGKLLHGELLNSMDRLAAARDKARAFANFHYIDLYAYAAAIEVQFSADSDIVKAAKGVISAVQKAVLAKTTNSNDAYGLSVYLPNSPAIDKIYKELAFTKQQQSEWYKFVIAYSNASRPVS